MGMCWRTRCALHPYCYRSSPRSKLLSESPLEGCGGIQLFYSISCRWPKDQIWEQSRQISYLTVWMYLNRFLCSWSYVYKYGGIFSSGWLPSFFHLSWVNTSFYLSTIEKLCSFRTKHMKFKRAFYWLFPSLIPTLAFYFTAPKAPLISKFSVLSLPPLLLWLKGDSDITVHVVIHSCQGYLKRCF